MNQFTELQTLLTLYLKHLKLDDAAILFIMLTLESDIAQEAFVLYLRNHLHPTQEELMQKAVDYQEIAEEMKDELEAMED